MNREIKKINALIISSMENIERLTDKIAFLEQEKKAIEREEEKETQTQESKPDSLISILMEWQQSRIAFIQVLIVTSLYIQWMPIYSNTVIGLQGRYYLPLLLPAYLLLTKDGYVENAEERFDMGCQYVILIANVSACICMLFSCI